MSLAMTVEAGSVRRTAKLDLDELEALGREAERKSDLQTAVAVVFGGGDLAGSKRVACGVLLDAIAALLRDANPGLRATVYSIYGSPHAGWPRGSASSMTGARVGDDLYHLIGGVDQCTLETYRQDERGEWTRVSSEDARHLKVIKADNMGDIEIRKRTKPGNTLKWLRQLREDLAGMSPETGVTITIG